MTVTLDPPGVEPAVRAGRPGRVWWLSPVAVTALLVPLSILPTMFISDDTFRLQWDVPKTITASQCLLLLAGGLSLTLAAAVVVQARPLSVREGVWPALRPVEVQVLRRASLVLFGLTVVGYLAFVFAGYRAGVSLNQVVTALTEGSVVDGMIKKDVGTIPGVTTLTQVGMASAVVSALLLAHRRSAREFIQLGIIFFFAALRAFLLTERLALLELIVPITVVVALRAAQSVRGGRIIQLAPIVMAPFVVVVFTSFEYTRSWVYYKTKSDTPLAQWAIERLIGYYATALNNGALEIMYNRYPARLPYETISAFWTAPGIANIELYKRLTGFDNPDYLLMILNTYGSPEFNNSSGIAAPFVDLGTWGGFAYLLLAGGVIGFLYRGFRESGHAGLLIYPIIFLAIVELPRYLGWSQGRNLPAYLALAIVAFFLRRTRKVGS